LSIEIKKEEEEENGRDQGKVREEFGQISQVLE